MKSRRKTRLVTPNVNVLLWVIRNYVEKDPEKELNTNPQAFKVERRDAIKALEYLDSMFAANRKAIGCGGWPKQKLQEYIDYQIAVGCGDWPKHRCLSKI